MMIWLEAKWLWEEFLEVEQPVKGSLAPETQEAQQASLPRHWYVDLKKDENSRNLVKSIYTEARKDRTQDRSWEDGKKFKVHDWKEIIRKHISFKNDAQST